MDHDALSETGQEVREWSGQNIHPWSRYSQLSAATTIIAERLCERLDLRPGRLILDVATGIGNGALAAARRGCQVRGIDQDPALLERARERARAERLRVGFQLGAVEAIPFPDASFDGVVSIFGATFAPDPRQTATELLRVCRPGGTIALTTWTPDSFMGAIFRRTGRETVQSGRWTDLATWGTDHGIHSLFRAHSLNLAIRPRGFVFRYASPEELLQLMQVYEGSPLPALAPADHPENSAVVRALASVVRRFNQAEDGSVIVPSDYLEVVATKR